MENHLDLLLGSLSIPLVIIITILLKVIPIVIAGYILIKIYDRVVNKKSK